jgi:hypothetical protein
VRSLFFTVLMLLVMGCGPGRTGDSSSGQQARPLTTAEKLIGEWSILHQGKSQGSLSLFPDGTFLLVQANSEQPGVFVTLSGSYVVEGDQVTRTIERLDQIIGADVAMAKQIEKAAKEFFGQELTNTVVWKDENEFEFRDDIADRATFRRKGT